MGGNFRPIGVLSSSANTSPAAAASPRLSRQSRTRATKYSAHARAVGFTERASVCDADGFARARTRAMGGAIDAPMAVYSSLPSTNASSSAFLLYAPTYYTLRRPTNTTTTATPVSEVRRGGRRLLAPPPPRCGRGGHGRVRLISADENGFMLVRRPLLPPSPCRCTLPVTSGQKIRKHIQT